MKRGGSGGGQSSLGYLFGSEGEKPKNEAPPPSQTTYAPPPYGIDISTDEKPLKSPSHSSQDKTKVISSDYIRVQGQNSGNFITDRPSTRVKSAPGGDSSLGYLFGDK